MVSFFSFSPFLHFPLFFITSVYFCNQKKIKTTMRGSTVSVLTCFHAFSFLLVYLASHLAFLGLPRLQLPCLTHRSLHSLLLPVAVSLLSFSLHRISHDLGVWFIWYTLFQLFRTKILLESLSSTPDCNVLERPPAPHHLRWCHAHNLGCDSLWAAFLLPSLPTTMCPS